MYLDGSLIVISLLPHNFISFLMLVDCNWSGVWGITDHGGPLNTGLEMLVQGLNCGATGMLIALSLVPIVFDIYPCSEMIGRWR